MVSHKYKCIFIHIPKTAGTSIERVFSHIKDDLPRGRQDHRRIINIQKAIWPPSRARYYPSDLAHYINQRTKGKSRNFEFASKKQFDEYFKFTIVRNPWDRAYSWYRNIMRDEIHQKALNINSGCSFNEFINNHLDNWALKPQIDWLKDENNNIQFDFIGKFEDLNETFYKIRSRFNIKDTELPITLYSGKNDFRKAYDNNSKTIIAEHFASEIELFNYSFDN